MTDLSGIKAAARRAAFARRKTAHANAGPGLAGRLSEVLAGYRGVPLSGYMAIRTEIDPLPAMAEAAAHGLVCVPVIRAAGQPLVFSRWEPDTEMVAGPFGATIPAIEELVVPEILIVPLVAVHLFVFYFGILADDTPPVGLAAYAAAAISKIGRASCRERV